MNPPFTSLALAAFVLSSLTIARQLDMFGDAALLRNRRKVGPYSGPGPLEYMKQLRETINDRFGGPRDVWVLLDHGEQGSVRHVFVCASIQLRCSTRGCLLFPLKYFTLH